MRDCPACKVPLHGYEEECPSCGTKQMPSRKRGPYGAEWKPDEPKVNMMPFIVVIVCFGIFVVMAMQGGWVGQLAKRGNQEVDPMEKLTYMDARNIIDSELNKNLISVGAKNSKLTWKVSGGDPTLSQSNAGVDVRTIDGPVELTVDTTLPQPTLRQQVVDPVKPYMEKAKLYSLMMNDSKSHAHWTYTMTPGTQADPNAGVDR